jgi:hypothetical protein
MLLIIEMCILFSLQLPLKHFSLKEETSEILSQMNIDINVKHQLFLGQMLIKLEFSQQIFKKCSNITFCENLSSGN